jgi:adenine phosphoribosyltransferase
MSGDGSEHDPRRALLRARVRDVPDFPKPGILFRDLTPLMGDGAAMREAVDMLSEAAVRHRPELIVAIESRGFIFGAPVAASLNIGFVPVRKPGKLPWDTHAHSYELEYGSDTLEVHRDALEPDDRVLIVDDVLATGGTATATSILVSEFFTATVVGLTFLLELPALGGRERLRPLGHRVESILSL